MLHAKATLLARLRTQIRLGPTRALGNNFVVIGAELLNERKKLCASAVGDGDHGVAAEAGALGPADRGSAKGFSKLFRRNFREPLERWIHQSRTRREISRRRDRRFAVPRANILADVTAEHVAAHSRSEILRNRTALFNSEV